MSIRWIAVQYVGDMLRLPVVNEGDMDKPFGGSVLERDIKRIVVNPFSDAPQTFVPELENAKLRELVRNLLRVIPRDVSGVVIGAHGEHPTYYSFADAIRKLEVEVDV